MNLQTAVTMHLWFAVYITAFMILICAHSQCFLVIGTGAFFHFCRHAEFQQQLTERDAETNRLQREVRELRVRKNMASVTFFHIKNLLWLPSSASVYMVCAVDSN